MTYLSLPYDELTTEQKDLVDKYDGVCSEIEDLEYEEDELQDRLAVVQDAKEEAEFEEEQLWVEMYSLGLIQEDTLAFAQSSWKTSNYKENKK